MKIISFKVWLIQMELKSIDSESKNQLLRRPRASTISGSMITIFHHFLVVMSYDIIVIQEMRLTGSLKSPFALMGDHIDDVLSGVVANREERNSAVVFSFHFNHIRH